MTLKPGLGSLKVIENYTIQSGTHDFLLTFHSNHPLISHRFRDKRQCPSKVARKSPIFPPPCIYRPRWRGSPWNFVSAQVVPNASMMGLSDGWKSFKIGLVVLIQPASQPRCCSYYRAYCVAQVKMKHTPNLNPNSNPKYLVNSTTGSASIWAQTRNTCNYWCIIVTTVMAKWMCWFYCPSTRWTNIQYITLFSIHILTMVWGLFAPLLLIPVAGMEWKST